MDIVYIAAIVLLALLAALIAAGCGKLEARSGERP